MCSLERVRHQASGVPTTSTAAALHQTSRIDPQVHSEQKVRSSYGALEDPRYTLSN
jgi:hypothetical protein